MIRPLTTKIWRFRSQILTQIRLFFQQRGYLEVNTPILNPTGAVEPFIDSFQIRRQVSPKSPEALPRSDGWLITSPEYNLKILAAALKTSVFEISHSFREGDQGGEHTEEFLMLEWYNLGATMDDLITETHQLLQLLETGSVPTPGTEPRRQTIEQLFREFLGCGLGGEDLAEAARKRGLGSHSDRYDELFFSLFLNEVEPKLRTESPLFLTHYPMPLAALSKAEGSVARRFEVYWKGRELANGYEELLDHDEHERRFAEYNAIRKAMGRVEMEIDPQFMETLRSRSLPPCSGIALGIERLLMVLLGVDRISEVSPFA
ncbi:MAG: EF-P lysine aminoacylase GenX [Leptospirales bacterium]|nr:EF-P lysine aminoacylase GenX [Leptospirales bacterium]